MVDNSIVALGDAFVVRYMKYKGKYPAREFILEMPDRSRARFFAMAKRMADHGRLPTTVHGHQLRGDYSELFEFKPRDSRIFAFSYESNLYLTSGAPKRKPKAQEGDYSEAMTLRADFMEREAAKQARQARTRTPH